MPAKGNWQPSPTEIARISEHIVQPIDEEKLYPLLLYRGQGDIGRARSMLNYFVAGMETDTEKVSTLAWRSADHGWLSDMAHLTGLHYEMSHNLQPIRHWGTRLLANPGVTDLVHGLGDYLQYLRADGGLYEVPLVPIPRWSPFQGAKPWRYQPILRSYADYASRDCSQCGRPFQPQHHQERYCQPCRERRSARTSLVDIPQQWPYLPVEAPTLEGVVLLRSIEAAVPQGIAQQVREDLCQDILVALLTGELEERNLQADMQKFIKQAYKRAPMKYGMRSLDAPLYDDGSRSMLDTIPGRETNAFAYLR